MMKKSNLNNDLRNKSAPLKGCLSCGRVDQIKKRKYCSIDCRRRLRYTLNIRTGLLKALNTKNATFYFTDLMIVLDVLPYHTKEIFSFIYPRSLDTTPADDFCKMSNLLSKTWWERKKETDKNYLASDHVFKQADGNHVTKKGLNPLKIAIPSIKKSSLLHLKLGRSELDSPELLQIIKSAFREQAKMHHPDLGGDARSFRKIHQAYEDLINWAEQPSFIRRKGFTDKWFYEGQNNRWVQPIPEP